MKGKGGAGAAALLAVLAWILFTAACEEAPIEAPVANLAPETHLSVVFSDSLYPDTLLSRVVLQWWGNDPDGEIDHYEYHWNFQPDTCSGPCWETTVLEADTFFLPLSAEIDSFAFQVRAVDREGLADPTPAFTRLYPIIPPPVSTSWPTPWRPIPTWTRFLLIP